MESGMNKFIDRFKVYEASEEISVNTSPVVKLVNEIIEKGIEKEASDIHIEAGEFGVRVRYRINGDLYKDKLLELDLLNLILIRVKVMSNLDISENRLPQDGRMNYSYEDKSVDLRISIIPTIFGEKIVIRILNNKYNYQLEDLGFKVEDLDFIKDIIKKESGMIIVTGPTGSGKSTTLYSFLDSINNESKNVVTIEDPVEYKILGINQIQVNERIDFNFPKILRSILRQDPDVIMLGEIRDSLTASIAIRAAITGHLVLTTLHTRDSISTVSRLLDMGIDNYLINSAVSLVIAQRLVKILCNNCKIKLDGHIFKENIEGCKMCNKGISKRQGIYELLYIDTEIKSCIKERNLEDMYKLRNKRHNSLEEQVDFLFSEGKISKEEYLRLKVSY